MDQIFSKFSRPQDLDKLDLSVARQKPIIALRRLYNLCSLSLQHIIFWRGSDSPVPGLRKGIAELKEANFYTLGGCLSADGFAFLITKAKGDVDLPFVVRIYIPSKLGDLLNEEFFEVTNFQVDASQFWVRLDRDRLVCCLVQGYQQDLTISELYTVFYELEFHEIRELVRFLQYSSELNDEKLKMLSEHIRSKIRLTVLEDCSAALCPEGKFMVFSESWTFLV